MASPGGRSWESGRIGPAIGVVAIHALLGYALIAGLTVSLPVRFADDSIIVVNLKPPPPPKPPPPQPPRKPREPAKQGGGAPAAKPRPLPEIPLPVRPPPPQVIVVPPVLTGGNPAGDGTGGIGAGAGSGGAGSGQGEGAGSGRGFSGARQIGGRFRNSDFPASAKGAGRLKIGVRYAVGPSGRVDRCEIIQPSGYPEVDTMTCRVIQDRYRFKPARDGEGVPVTEVMEEDYSWRMD